ncbi:MAG TPA: T9SS type A sorting domain-containing protein [bacterium]
MGMHGLTRALAVVCITVFLLSAQPDTLWTKTYGGFNGDIARCVQQTNDGGFILTGGTASYGAGDMDIYIIRTDSLGESLWTKTYGGFYNDGSEWIECTVDGGYMIAGRRGNDGGSNSDVWLIKINSLGDTLWTKTFGGDGTEGTSMAKQVTDTGYIVVGFTNSSGSGLNDLWLLRVDSAGDTIWTKTYGGSLNDGGTRVLQTSDKGYMILGGTYSYGAGQSDGWMIKADSQGNAQWSKTYGGTNYDFVYEMVETQDHGYFITGMTMSFGNGHADAWFIRTDSLGDTLWTKTLGDTGYEYAESGVQTADGGFIACGYKETNWIYDLWIMKLDSTGNCSWTKTLGHGFHEYGQSIRQTRDGGYICAGDYYYASGNYDIWLIRLAAETSIAEDDQHLLKDRCSQDRVVINASPNPFNSHLHIYYNLEEIGEPRIPESGHTAAALKIYSAAGCLVKQWNEPAVKQSTHIIWSGTNQNELPVPSGIYFIQLETNNYKCAKKVVLLR